MVVACRALEVGNGIVKGSVNTQELVVLETCAGVGLKKKLLAVKDDSGGDGGCGSEELLITGAKTVTVAVAVEASGGDE